MLVFGVWVLLFAVILQLNILYDTLHQPSQDISVCSLI